MANCAKCGQGFIRKRKCGRFKCKNCGFLPRDKHLDRSGNIMPRYLVQYYANGEYGDTLVTTKDRHEAAKIVTEILDAEDCEILEVKED